MTRSERFRLRRARKARRWRETNATLKRVYTPVLDAALGLMEAESRAFRDAMEGKVRSVLGSQF